MESFFAFVVPAAIMIACAAYKRGGAGRAVFAAAAAQPDGMAGPACGVSAAQMLRPAGGSRQQDSCPYCGESGGELSGGCAVCPSCRRTYVIGREMTPAERTAVQKEASEIAFIDSSSFPLDAVKRCVVAACRGEGSFAPGPGEKLTGVVFLTDRLEARLACADHAAPGRSILTYPALRTEAGRQALAAACFYHMKHLYMGDQEVRHPGHSAELGEFTITWDR